MWLESNSADDVRFEQEWQNYLERIKKTTGEANYRNVESFGRIYLLPALTHKKLSKITSAHWQDCIDSAYGAGRSRRTCVNLRSIIMAFYKHCKKARLPLEEPFALTIPNGAKKGVRTILQPDELRTLFAEDTITQYSRKKECFYIHAFRLIVILGLRRGELCGLRATDLKDGVLHIQRSINRINIETDGKNENANHYIALPDHAKQILTAQADMLKRYSIVSPWLFPNQEGDSTDSNSLYKHWYTYRKQHGIESSIHELRHTMVSILKSDMPEALMKMMVGHSESMDTDGIYGHEFSGDLERTAKIVDNVYDRLLK
jgi:integrase